MTDARLSEAVSAALGDRVIEMTRVGGGDVAEAYRVRLARGGTAFAKTHLAPPPGF
nr:hypothetical protein [Actinomycetota bacterium]